jgi:hypothetical protein
LPVLGKKPRLRKYKLRSVIKELKENDFKRVLEHGDPRDVFIDSGEKILRHF